MAAARGEAGRQQVRADVCYGVQMPCKAGKRHTAQAIGAGSVTGPAQCKPLLAPTLHHAPLVGLVSAPRMNSSGRCSGRMTTCAAEGNGDDGV